MLLDYGYGSYLAVMGHIWLWFPTEHPFVSDTPVPRCDAHKLGNTPLTTHNSQAQRKEAVENWGKTLFFRTHSESRTVC